MAPGAARMRELSLRVASRTLGALALMLFCLQSSAQAEAGEPAVQPRVRPAGLLTARSLRIAGGRDKNSRMFLGPDGSGFSIGTDANTGSFSIRQDSRPEPLFDLELHEDGANDKVRFLSKNLRVASLTAPLGVLVNGIRQWELARAEDFTGGAAGWSRPTVTQCGGVSMLGGFCRFSTGEVNKTYTSLPAHRQIRIKATYHFIDRWIGEAGFMKVNLGADDRPVVVWSEQWTQAMSKNGMNICGQKATPEGKFATAIDIILEHTADSVQLGFGSTMTDTDPCDESWGVSGVEIYTREGPMKLDSGNGPVGFNRPVELTPTAV